MSPGGQGARDRTAARPRPWAAALCLLLLACAPGKAREPAHLAARLFQVPGIEILAAEGLSAGSRAACERLAQRWSRGQNQAQRAFATRVLAPGESGSRRCARVVVGAPSAPELAPLLASLGVELDEKGGFRYLERGFLARHALVATFEDPERPGCPLTLVVCGDEAELEHRLRLLEPVGWPGARAFRDGEPVLELRLGLAGGAQRATLVDRAVARRELLGRSLSVPEPPAGLEVLLGPGIDRQRIAATGAIAARALGAAHALLEGAEIEPRPGPWRLQFVGRPADLARSSGRVELSIPQPSLALVTMLVAPGLADDGGAGLARAALVAALGAPSEAWLAEAAGVELANSWWGRPLLEWGAHLVDAALLPGAQALIEPFADLRVSPHVLVPGRALLVRYLREQLGDRGLVAWWSGEFGAGLGAEEGVRRRAQVFEGFEPWLGSTLQPALVESRARRAQRRTQFEARSFRRGVALDSRPAPGGNLMGGDLGASLDQARALGADSASQLAYFVEHPPEARFAGLLAPPRLGPLEGDATIAQALGLARARGMATLLRPVLLLSDSGSLAGWARRTRLEEWARHFEARAAALLHAALLGELCGAELLSVGEDEGDASMATAGRAGRQSEELLSFKRQRWVHSIEQARRAFSGGTTFLAAFPQEAELFELWEHVDLLGILFLARIEAPNAEGPDAAILREAMQSQLVRAAHLGERHDRPVLIGEVAFRSTSQAWRDPELGFGSPDAELQAELFEAFLTALRRNRSQPERFAGYFVWGWGPDPSSGALGDRGYSPQNKPAAELLFR